MWLFPCSIYIAALNLQWIQKHGGLDGMEKLSRQKSGLIYDVIDKSDGFYRYLVLCVKEELEKKEISITEAKHEIRSLEESGKMMKS